MNTDALELLQSARHQLAMLEQSLSLGNLAAAIEDQLIAKPCDIVQLKTSADETWGGMIMRVKRVHNGRLEGYLLRPHRGGWRDAWYKAKLCEITPVGNLTWPEAQWGFRPW